MSSIPSPDRELKRDVEVTEKSRRRSFTAAYKLKILAEADLANQRGELGALLRREGLYSSHLAEWRRLAKSGALGGLSANKRGPKPKVGDAQSSRIAKLERELAIKTKRLEHAELIIEVQKKVATLLGITLDTIESP